MTKGLRECVLAAADAVVAARDELGRLDAVAGDGDHGVTMTLAARAVRARLDELPEAGGPDLLAGIAPGVAAVGGAIGPIYATALLRLAADGRAMAPGAPAPTVAEAHALARSVLDAITVLGGARPGDKTVVDSLAPAVEALAVADHDGLALEQALDSAVAAARSGAAATAAMVATVGRASRLGERSRGSPDPGATSFAIILAAAVGVWTRDGGASGGEAR